jgi:hypothetical protein
VLQVGRSSTYATKSERCVLDIYLFIRCIEAFSPSFQHCRDRGKEFWHSCVSGLGGNEDDQSCSTETKIGHTKLSENVPKPVDDKHGLALSYVYSTTCMNG